MPLKISVILRTLFIGGALAAMLIGLPAWGAERPSLRPNVTVDGALVTLGDLIEGAGEAAEIAVFRSPDPGTSGTIGAGRVVAAAIKHGLTNLSGQDIDVVSVTRSGRAISAEDVERLIAEHLAQEGVIDSPENASISLDRFDNTVHAEAASVEPLSIKTLQHDRRTGRFSAVLRITDSRTLGTGFSVAGRAVEVIDVPVLVRGLKRGETISSGDLAVERVPRSEVRGDAILSRDDLIGMAARRSLRPSTPISGDSVMEPILVSRNEPVTLVYQAPGLTLTARGRAIAAGARGEVVTVINSQSNRTVEAEVTGSGVVTVLAPRRHAAAFADAR